MITQLINSNGNAVKNQFVIDGEYLGQPGKFFQSYSTIIAFKPADGSSITLDRASWDYSQTTIRHRNTFTGYNSQQTKQMIKDRSIILADLQGVI